MITLAYPYYNSKDLLQKNIDVWKTYSSELLRRVHLLIVDDGSKEPLTIQPEIPMRLTIARVTKDIHWNQPGARNLAMALALTEWVFVADLDHVLSPENITVFVDAQKSPDTVYYFPRKDEEGQDRGVHISSFGMHRHTFWKLGGVDEDFCGHYGWDDFIFYDIVKAQCKIHVFSDYMLQIRNSRTHDLKRKAKRNKHLITKKRKILAQGKYCNGPVLRFPWKIAYDHIPGK